jgi:hypothetical protein
MSGAQISLEDLVQAFLLYGILPGWVFFGFIDYLCHRASRIEETTGLRENLLHSVMGLQVAIPIFFGLFLEINVLVLLLMLFVLAAHELVAHMDVSLALKGRRISVWENHAHSFLEVIPFGIFGLVALLKWPAFVDLITLDWAGKLYFAPKADPISSSFIVGYFLFMVLLGFLPYMEENWRCLKGRRR